MSARLFTDAEIWAAAKHRDPSWDSDPPLNRHLYREGWRDAEIALAARRLSQERKRE